MADPGRPEARGRDVEALARSYANLTERFEAAGGYEYRTQVAQSLTGLGFSVTGFRRPVAELSGGEKVRAALARLLLARPGLLLLDEPTNHLDLRATEWLEGFLAGYRGAAVIVSHDRYFLDRLVTRVVELEGGHIWQYPGNYTDFVRAKEEALLRDAARRRELETDADNLRVFIARFRSGTRARQAASKARALARVEERAAELRDYRRQAGPKFRFEARRTSGKDVLRVAGLCKSYGERRLFGPLDLAVSGGQRLGIAGPNGCGKTTLLRILLGEEPADGGEVWWGHGVEVGYLRQDLGGLDDGETVLDTILRAVDLTPGEARSWLGTFLFRGDDVFKLIRELSGGERCRLALSKLLAGGCNTLVLDEPTNHLDIPARAALERALGLYAGTVLFVSHDRYFIDRVAGAVLVFESGGPVYHRGNFSSYRREGASRPGTAAGQRAGTSGSRRQRDEATVESLLAERAVLEAEMRLEDGSPRRRESRRRLQRYRAILAELERLGYDARRP